jgi:hypothetical protein
MRKIVVTTTLIAAVALLVAACGKKAVEGPSAEEIRNDVAGVTREINAYLSEHNFSNTDAGALAEKLNELAGKYGELEKRAQDMRTEGGGEEYGDVGNLADEGRAKVEALASVLGAGPPMGDAERAAEFDDVITNWADYSERVGPPPGEAAPVEGGEPGVGEPAPPGEAEPAPPEGVEPGTPSYPGRGYHYGWWKNPEWARDRGTRPMMEGGGMAGTGEMERERERKRDGTGSGPEREREREHMQPGMGPGGDMGHGGGMGGGKGKGGK